MKHRNRRWLSILLSVMLAVQLFPASALAVFAGKTPGDVLFTGERNIERRLVSETDYDLAPGVRESVVYSNEPSGMDQNIDFFCEIDPSQAEIMAGYAGMENILTNNTITWQMQTVSDQAKKTQKFFNSSVKYQDNTIVAALNADWYNMATGQPRGLLIIDGKTYNPPGGYYYFGIKEDGTAVISNDTNTEGLKSAISGNEPIVLNGEVVVEQGVLNVTYSAIGIKSDGTVVSMVSYGQSYPISCGYTTYEVAQMMKARGCVTALLLDGSGSSTFVSRRDGDSEVITRNHPSDGQERQVSSSIFIVSKVKADGIFDHAAVSPANEVYTPGSTVTFTAAGADKSGAPAQMPESFSWSLADGSFGTIDSSTGIFTSSGKTGEVKVNCNSKGQIVGSATILVQEPDQLLFSAGKVSVGFGDSSDLGFQARYQNRDVHYNAGDFIWVLSNEDMGRFSGNIFTAHESNSVTGMAVATSKWDEAVTASVEIEVGKEPLVAMDFETPGASVFHGKTEGGLNQLLGYFDESGKYIEYGSQTSSDTLDSDYLCLSYTGRNTEESQVGTARVVSRGEGYPVRFGDCSLKVDYNFTANAGKTDGVCFGDINEIRLEGNPTKIGVWVYIPEGTPNIWLRLAYLDGEGRSSFIGFTDQSVMVNEQGTLADFADNSWHYFEADISKLITPVSIPAGMSLRLMVGNPVNGIDSNFGWYVKDPEAAEGYSKIATSEGYGTLYFDNLTYIFGSSNEDTAPPVVSSVTANSVALEDGASFATGNLDIDALYSDSKETSLFNTGIDRAAFYVDGLEITGTVNNDTEYRTGIKLSQGAHVLKLSVLDNYGNETIKTYNITISDPAAENQPVEMSIREKSAALGGEVHVDFTQKDSSVTGMDVTVAINKAFAGSYTLEAKNGCTATEPVYNNITNTLSFSVSGSAGDGGVMATLKFGVPTTIEAGTQFTCRVTRGVVSWGGEHEALPTFCGRGAAIDIVAPYSVSSGTIVRGLEDTYFFTITDTDGKAASGVTLYKSDGTAIATSGADGKVKYIPAENETTIRVYAKDGKDNMSGVYTTLVYTPQGNEDGKPDHVWQNAADGANSENISWMSNPLKTGDNAVLRLSTAENLEGAEEISGVSRLVGFSGGNAAARVCGVTLTQLIPGTTYYYSVGDGTQSHWSEVRSFTTVYENSDVNVLVLGDLQKSDSSTLDGMLKTLDLSSYDLTVQTGDLVDSGSNYGYWDGTLEMLSGLDNDRLFCLGNHEFEGGLDVSKLLYNQEINDYFSVEYGNVYIASIAYGGGSAGYAAALEWLKEDAAASDATWKILATHQPAYYTNAAGGNDAVHDIIPLAAQQAGIDIVLSGHDHSYARTAPLWDGQVDSDKGITYFICGSLGEKSYTVTNNPGFHFDKVSDSFNAAYLTLSTSDNKLSVSAYDYKKNGEIELIDSFTKIKDEGAHTHEYIWDGGSRLVCSCGYGISAKTYTGYAGYTIDGKSGRVYLNAGKLMTGVFAAGDEVLHAGENGLLHETETINTAQCWSDGYLGCLCRDCNTFYQLTAARRQGHDYDENHVCKRKVFDMDTFTWTVCGHHGKDIATLDMKLAYQYGFYDGKAKKPGVTITDTLPDGTVYTLHPQSTYGDYMPYWDNNVEVGTATVRIEGYSDGPYYGTAQLTFQIVPNNVNKITAAGTTSNSVTLSWDAPLGAEEYIVYQSVDGQWTRLDVIRETEYTVTGLSAGEHQFRIRPYKNVDGTYYYSTRNSDILKVAIQGGGVGFEENGVVRTYGDEPFVNAASLQGSSDGFAYTSSDPSVATVDDLGAVTILKAGSCVITAKKGEVSGQYRLKVNPKTVELSWSGTDERAYDGSPSNVTASVTGLLAGDTAEVTVTGGAEKNAGIHTAHAAVSNENYALPQNADVVYTIRPAEISVTWENTELTYTGAMQAPTALAGDGLIAGDTVEFSVPGASEPGTYRVSAASTNPNYVVGSGAGQETAFTISMPSITVEGTDSDDLTCYMDGMTIYICGMASGEVTINAVGANGVSTSSAISPGSSQTGIELMGVNYLINTENLVSSSAAVEVIQGSTRGIISEKLELPEDDTAIVTKAIESSENNLDKLTSAIYANIEKLTGGQQEEERDIFLHVSMAISATQYESGSYTVDIEPVYYISDSAKEDESADKAAIPNELISAPVAVTLKIPDGIGLSSSTYIRHRLEDGRIEYIKPTEFDAENSTVTFLTRSFSEFTICTDERSGSITFAFADGATQTREYFPENIGAALPTASKDGYVFKGWEIEGQLYTAMTDELLTRIAAGAQATASFSSISHDIPIGGAGGGTITYPVALPESVSHGAVSAAPEKAEAGATVTVTVTPDDGYRLDALTAADADGKELTLRRISGARYAFTMPASKVTISVGFVQRQPCPFTDVKPGDYYYDAVIWAAENGIAAGVSGTSFAPNAGCTRAQVVSFLWRAAGSPEPAGSSCKFKDVSESQYYYKAVLWAVENGITAGTSDTAFSPDAAVTRAQFVTLLYRYSGERAAEGGKTFTDIDRSAYYYDAVLWAVEKGITAGTSEHAFSPDGNCSRGQTVTFIYRYMGA